MLEGTFLLSALVLSYTWIGYGLLLALVRCFRKLHIEKRPFTPRVSIIVAAKNEESRIRGRIEDLLCLDYPAGELEIIVASDGSTDHTAPIVRSFSDDRVRLLEFPKTRGRAAVHNDAVRAATGEILVFTDAATRFARFFLRNVVANFADPCVGCVSGVLVFQNQEASALARQRGLYWRYEYWLRRLESESGVFACASGPCMAVRKRLYRPLSDTSYDVDFLTPLDVVEAGALVLQEDEAIAFDEMFSTPQQELRAQIRMVSRNLCGYLDRRFLLNSRAHAWFAWSILSHKVLRWMTPFFLVLLFVSSALLAVRGQARPLWLAQIVFYAAALIGWLQVRAGRPAPVVSAPFAFCLANLGFLLGVLRCFRSERIAVY